jgi:hypothetical protein
MRAWPIAAALSFALAAGAAAIPASAGTLVFNAFLNGASEVPANASPGTGFAKVFWDEDAFTMRVTVDFEDLIGLTTASHIHAATATPGSGTAGVATGVPTFAGFPLGVRFGAYDHTFDMADPASYNPAYVTAHGGTTAQAGADLLAAMQAGEAYLNIHTDFARGGEIRGFLAQVPEPQAWALVLAGFGAVGTVLRRRRTVVA